MVFFEEMRLSLGLEHLEFGRVPCGATLLAERVGKNDVPTLRLLGLGV